MRPSKPEGSASQQLDSLINRNSLLSWTTYVMSPQDVYARFLLLSAGRGFPLWIPEPSHEFLMQRREGLTIGDVGVVLDDGGFDVFFNICLPPDHPFHLRYGVPQGFSCIHPGELDIRTIVDAEPPGHVISSSSIMRETFGSSSDVSKRYAPLFGPRGVW